MRSETMTDEQIVEALAVEVMGMNPDKEDCDWFNPLTDFSHAFMVMNKVGIAIVPSEDGWYAIKPQDIEHGCVRGTDHPSMRLVGAEGEVFRASDDPLRAICLSALAAVKGEGE